MIEVYAFLAMFAVQILALSALHMVALIKFVRAKMAEIPDEYFTTVSPDVGRNQSAKWFAIVYRAAQALIALLGLLLLGWLFSHMGRPDWGSITMMMLSPAYFMLTMLPMVLIALLILAINGPKAFRNLPMVKKRTAVLQRRGLFDFVSPFTVWFAVVLYFLSVAFIIYLQIEPLKALRFIGALTWIYALTAFLVYRNLYAKKSDLHEAHADRMQRIGREVRYSVYSCIGWGAFLWASMIGTLDLSRWMPFVMSVSMVIATLEGIKELKVASRKPEADVLGESSAH